MLEKSVSALTKREDKSFVLWHSAVQLRSSWPLQDTEIVFSEYVDSLMACPCAIALCAALEVGDPWQRCSPDALVQCLHPDAVGRPEPADSSGDVLRVHTSVCG